MQKMAPLSAEILFLLKLKNDETAEEYIPGQKSLVTTIQFSGQIPVSTGFKMFIRNGIQKFTCLGSIIKPLWPFDQGHIFKESWCLNLCASLYKGLNNFPQNMKNEYTTLWFLLT